MEGYTHLSHGDLALLHKQSMVALEVVNSHHMEEFIKSFFDIFPVKQFACVSFDTSESGYRLLALYNFGYPNEREASFQKKNKISACDAILPHRDIVVNVWNRKSKGHALGGIGKDAEKYDIYAGLYGVIKPRNAMGGILCSLAGEKVTLKHRYPELLRCWMPYFQLAQSRISGGVEKGRITERAELTRREIDVLQWLSKGKTNWEVGRILGISESTVKFHVSNLSCKLGASNRAHVVALAQGIL